MHTANVIAVHDNAVPKKQRWIASPVLSPRLQ